jgi:hypothetical protein
LAAAFVKVISGIIFLHQKFMTMKKITQTAILCFVSAFMYAQSACQFWPVFSGTSGNAPNCNNMSISHTSAGGNLSGPFAYSILSATPVYFTPNHNVNTISPPNQVAHNVSDLGVFGIYPISTNDRGTISFSRATTTPFRIHVYQLKSKMAFNRSFTVINTDGDFGLSIGSTGTALDARALPPTGDDANATIEFPAGITSLTYTMTAATDGIGDGVGLMFSFPQFCLCSDYSLYKPQYDKEITGVTEELDKVKNELAAAKAKYEAALKTIPAAKDKAVLIGCTPNPVFDEALISYYLPEGTRSASCVVSTVDGKVLQTYTLPVVKGNGQMKITTGKLEKAGVYMYSLKVDDATVDSKRIIVNR